MRRRAHRHPCVLAALGAGPCCDDHPHPLFLRRICWPLAWTGGASCLNVGTGLAEQEHSKPPKRAIRRSVATRTLPAQAWPPLPGATAAGGSRSGCAPRRGPCRSLGCRAGSRRTNRVAGGGPPQPCGNVRTRQCSRPSSLAMVRASIVTCDLPPMCVALPRSWRPKPVQAVVIASVFDGVLQAEPTCRGSRVRRQRRGRVARLSCRSTVCVHVTGTGEPL